MNSLCALWRGAVEPAYTGNKHWPGHEQQGWTLLGAVLPRREGGHGRGGPTAGPSRGTAPRASRCSRASSERHSATLASPLSAPGLKAAAAANRGGSASAASAAPLPCCRDGCLRLSTRLRPYNHGIEHMRWAYERPVSAEAVVGVLSWCLPKSLPHTEHMQRRETAALWCKCRAKSALAGLVAHICHGIACA
jgi:hypothetical protein